MVEIISKALQALNNAKYSVELAAEYNELFSSAQTRLALANARTALEKEENKTCFVYWTSTDHGWSYRLPNGVGGLVVGREDLDRLAEEYVLSAHRDNIEPIFPDFGVYLYALSTRS